MPGGNPGLFCNEFRLPRPFWRFSRLALIRRKRHRQRINVDAAFIFVRGCRSVVKADNRAKLSGRSVTKSCWNLRSAKRAAENSFGFFLRETKAARQSIWSFRRASPFERRDPQSRRRGPKRPSAGYRHQGRSQRPAWRPWSILPRTSRTCRSSGS
ncbi:hypothetical protein D9M72_392530 [compost metagenome]